MNNRIRNLIKADREALIRITYETAFFGNSASIFFDDPNLFFDVGYLFYYLFEKNNSFVYTVDDNVAGYILSTESIFRRILLEITLIIPFYVIPKIVLSRYRIGRKTVDYILLLIKDFIYGRNLSESIFDYPSNLHINVLKNFRGKKIGSLLLRTGIKNLKMKKIKGLQLNTTSMNNSAIILYKRCLFKLSKSIKTNIWIKYINNDVYNLVYTLNLKYK
jgi:ribosomal protein S18 acetylase RimI-like enzyme